MAFRNAYGIAHVCNSHITAAAPTDGYTLQNRKIAGTQEQRVKAQTAPELWVELPEIIPTSGGGRATSPATLRVPASQPSCATEPQIYTWYLLLGTVCVFLHKRTNDFSANQVKNYS